MGTVDGEGMRMVVFSKDTPLRCAYCHNPDTWNEISDDAKFGMTVEELMVRNERNLYLILEWWYFHRVAMQIGKL